ncbi:MAG: ABC transporter ATP-binding protein [Gammaproteobacteria bacterium]|nr:ABC transporter ATP-binding protein [Gammaproteobacteria bacterium]
MAIAEMATVAPAALELRQIKKRYGDLSVLKNLEMNVEEGEIYGFLGRNGAGKSTALRIIMGITRADGGDIHLFGQSVAPNDPEPRQQIGYVAQEQHFYDWMTAPRLGRFVSGFYPSWDENEFRRLLHVLEVPTDRKILGFSGGMHTKLALCLALATKPKLLLLDEPTAGMDAVARREFIDIVRDDAVRSHRTTVFSSHLIDEVEMAADKVGILDNGVMRFEGSLQTLQQSVKRLIQIEPNTETANELPVLNTDILSDRVDRGFRELTVQYSAGEAEQPVADGWRAEQPSLEEIFVAMVSKPLRL